MFSKSNNGYIVVLYLTLNKGKVSFLFRHISNHTLPDYLRIINETGTIQNGSIGYYKQKLVTIWEMRILDESRWNNVEHLQNPIKLLFVRIQDR